jgi:long-chain acyl-CoA synthetase
MSVSQRRRPFAWERSYPPGLDWDVVLETSTIGAMFDGAVARFADRPAIEFLDRRTTYRELACAVEAMRIALRGLGVRKGDRVALLLPNSPVHPISFFALAKLGAIVVHISPLDGERVQRYKLMDSGAKLLISAKQESTLSRALAFLDAGIVECLILADGVRCEHEIPETRAVVRRANVFEMSRLLSETSSCGNDEQIVVDPESIVLIQYTGGTTGLPKGAMLSHRNLSSAVASYDAWNRGQGVVWPEIERIICVLPLFHIFALSVILLRGLNNGAEILLRERFDVEQTLDDIEARRATGLPGVPTLWIALTGHPDIGERDLSSLSLISSGGAPMPTEVAERFQQLTGLTLRNGWGMTETSPAGTNNPRHRPPKVGSIGVPLPGIEIDVVAIDEPRRELGFGEIGEIRVAGPNVFSGYWEKAEETAKVFVDDRFLTGDIGYMDPDGYIFLVDRKSDMIISGGFNVYPQMIEQAIYEHPDVEEVLVIGVPDAYRGESAKAFVKLRAGSEPFGLDELTAFLMEKIGRHEMPRALEIRDALPRTAVGKLSKAQLRETELLARSTSDGKIKQLS